MNDTSARTHSVRRAAADLSGRRVSADQSLAFMSDERSEPQPACGGRSRGRSGGFPLESDGVRGDGLSDESILLDLPVVAAALGRRLYAAGLPVTLERAATFAEALTLIGPLSHRRLYCTARTVFVSDPMHLPAFDRVFASVFDGCPGDRSASYSTARADVRQGEDA